MPSYLLVIGEDPVNLNGTIDGAGGLQISHTSGCLVDYSQTLHAAHDDLNGPTGLVMIKIFDFSSGGMTWQMNVVHASTTWSRGTDHAYYEFGPMASEIEVDTTATSDGDPPTVKTRKIYIRTRPTDGLPDRPR